MYTKKRGVLKSCNKKNGHKLGSSGKRVQRKNLADGSPQKMSEEICAIWTTTQAQKVTLNIINVPRGEKLVLVPKRSSDWLKY